MREIDVIYKVKVPDEWTRDQIQEFLQDAGNPNGLELVSLTKDGE